MSCWVGEVAWEPQGCVSGSEELGGGGYWGDQEVTDTCQRGYGVWWSIEVSMCWCVQGLYQQMEWDSYTQVPATGKTGILGQLPGRLSVWSQLLEGSTLCIHIYKYSSNRPPSCSVREEDRMRPVVLFVFVWVLCVSDCDLCCQPCVYICMWCICVLCPCAYWEYRFSLLKDWIGAWSWDDLTLIRLQDWVTPLQYLFKKNNKKPQTNQNTVKCIIATWFKLVLFINLGWFHWVTIPLWKSTL